MAKTFVISGGNSGIGLEAGMELARQKHHVVLIGRDSAKGDAAVNAVRSAGGSADFIAADLSTHAGVKVCADKVSAACPKIDGLIECAGVLTTKDVRTGDGLHAVFAVNYLSRYDLGQRLLPNVKAANGAIIILVAGVPTDSTIDFTKWPKLDPFPGMSALSQIQIGNFHYAVHLAKTEPGIRVAVVNAGLVKTDILREMPAVLRVAFKWMPFITVSVQQSAANLVWLATSSGWTSGLYWPKPGKTERTEVPKVDPAVTAKVIEASRQLTGV